MIATTVIDKKRDGEVLTPDEIRFMIDGLVSGEVPDYQIAAWAMAMLCRGMNAAETATLTDCMLASGRSMQRVTDRPRVDKHSTGGLGDKVSLILVPLLATFELDVPMLSGRGLGITGGTLDKLEAYPGFRCDLGQAAIDRQLHAIGCVITDPRVGLEMLVRVGDRVETGQPLVKLFANDAAPREAAELLLRDAFRLADWPTSPRPLII